MPLRRRVGGQVLSALKRRKRAGVGEDSQSLARQPRTQSSAASREDKGKGDLKLTTPADTTANMGSVNDEVLHKQCLQTFTGHVSQQRQTDDTNYDDGQFGADINSRPQLSMSDSSNDDYKIPSHDDNDTEEKSNVDPVLISRTSNQQTMQDPTESAIAIIAQDHSPPEIAFLLNFVKSKKESEHNTLQHNNSTSIFENTSMLQWLSDVSTDPTDVCDGSQSLTVPVSSENLVNRLDKAWQRCSSMRSDISSLSVRCDVLFTQLQVIKHYLTPCSNTVHTQCYPCLTASECQSFEKKQPSFPAKMPLELNVSLPYSTVDAIISNDAVTPNPKTSLDILEHVEEELSLRLDRLKSFIISGDELCDLSDEKKTEVTTQHRVEKEQEYSVFAVEDAAPVVHVQPISELKTVTINSASMGMSKQTSIMSASLPLTPPSSDESTCSKENRSCEGEDAGETLSMYKSQSGYGHRSRISSTPLLNGESSLSLCTTPAIEALTSLDTFCESGELKKSALRADQQSLESTTMIHTPSYSDLSSSSADQQLCQESCHNSPLVWRQCDEDMASKQSKCSSEEAVCSADSPERSCKQDYCHSSLLSSHQAVPGPDVVDEVEGQANCSEPEAASVLRASCEEVDTRDSDKELLQIDATPGTAQKSVCDTHTAESPEQYEQSSERHTDLRSCIMTLPVVNATNNSSNNQSPMDDTPTQSCEFYSECFSNVSLENNEENKHCPIEYDNICDYHRTASSHASPACLTDTETAQLTFDIPTKQPTSIQLSISKENKDGTAGKQKITATALSRAAVSKSLVSDELYIRRPANYRWHAPEFSRPGTVPETADKMFPSLKPTGRQYHASIEARGVRGKSAGFETVYRHCDSAEQRADLNRQNHHPFSSSRNSWKSGALNELLNELDSINVHHMKVPHTAVPDCDRQAPLNVHTRFRSAVKQKPRHKRVHQQRPDARRQHPAWMSRPAPYSPLSDTESYSSDSQVGQMNGRFVQSYSAVEGKSRRFNFLRNRFSSRLTHPPVEKLDNSDAIVEVNSHIKYPCCLTKSESADSGAVETQWLVQNQCTTHTALVEHCSVSSTSAIDNCGQVTFSLQSHICTSSAEQCNSIYTQSLSSGRHNRMNTSYLMAEDQSRIVREARMKHAGDMVYVCQCHGNTVCGMSESTVCREKRQEKNLGRKDTISSVVDERKTPGRSDDSVEVTCSAAKIPEQVDIHGVNCDSSEKTSAESLQHSPVEKPSCSSLTRNSPEGHATSQKFVTLATAQNIADPVYLQDTLHYKQLDGKQISHPVAFSRCDTMLTSTPLVSSSKMIRQTITSVGPAFFGHESGVDQSYILDTSFTTDIGMASQSNHATSEVLACTEDQADYQGMAGCMRRLESQLPKQQKTTGSDGEGKASQSAGSKPGLATESLPLTMSHRDADSSPRTAFTSADKVPVQDKSSKDHSFHADIKSSVPAFQRTYMVHPCAAQTSVEEDSPHGGKQGHEAFSDSSVQKIEVSKSLPESDLKHTETEMELNTSNTKGMAQKLQQCNTDLTPVKGRNTHLSDTYKAVTFRKQEQKAPPTIVNRDGNIGVKQGCDHGVDPVASVEEQPQASKPRPKPLLPTPAYRRPPIPLDPSAAGALPCPHCLCHAASTFPASCQHNTRPDGSAVSGDMCVEIPQYKDWWRTQIHHYGPLSRPYNGPVTVCGLHGGSSKPVSPMQAVKQHSENTQTMVLNTHPSHQQQGLDKGLLQRDSSSSTGKEQCLAEGRAGPYIARQGIMNTFPKPSAAHTMTLCGQSPAGLDAMRLLLNVDLIAQVMLAVMMLVGSVAVEVMMRGL